MQVDESLLTGESTPVTKHVDAVAETAPLPDRSCMDYAGAIVTAGRGTGVVVATGGAQSPFLSRVRRANPAIWAA